MTIASEITRLQWAKASIKSSIEWKWVTVPSGAKLNDYPGLIWQIKTSSWLDLFVPSTLTIADAIYNKNDSAAVTESIADIVSPDWNTYYHYFWFRNSSTTAYEGRCVWVFKKTKGSNPTLTVWDRLEESNYYYNRVQRNVNHRMKISWWNVMVSTLAYREYDSNGLSTHWGKVTATVYCVNITNGTISSINTLWSVGNLDDRYTYNYTILPNWEELWTASCWITAEESISSAGLTSLSFSRGSWSNDYNLNANVIFN